MMASAPYVLPMRAILPEAETYYLISTYLDWAYSPAQFTLPGAYARYTPTLYTPLLRRKSS